MKTATLGPELAIESTRVFPRGVRAWLMIVLAWQCVGLVGTLVLSLPRGNFHLLVSWLITGLTFTNLVGLLAGAVALAVRRWLWRHGVAVRVPAIVLGLALAVAFSVWVTLGVGRRVCGLDSFHVDRWHMLTIAVDAALMAVIALTCALVFLHQRFSADLARRVRDNAHLERLHVEAQLSLLQSKVNPHFLFNTLSTMLELVHNDPGKVERMILNLSEIYRKVLTWPESARVRLEDEVALVRQYLEIEKIRMGPRMEFAIDMPDGVRAVEIPPLILEILVENAVRHGIAPRKDGGSIRVSAARRDGRLLLEVTDNGVGIGERRTDTGFGLCSVRQRLHLLFGERAELRVEQLPEGGTRAAIELPYAD
jgi:two-component system LytT family sensor kinase